MTTILELAARLQSADAIETMLLVIAKATLILAIARLLLMVMPRASAATKHVVATAALVAVAAMPVMTVLVPAWNMAVIPAAKVEARAPQAADASAPATQGRTVGATDAEENETAPKSSGLGMAISVAKASGVVPDEPLTAMARAMNILETTWKGLLALSLLAMTLVMLAQMIIGMVGVWFVARNAEELTQDTALLELDNARDALALDRDVKLLRSSRISVPVLWGFFKPVLLLPADVVTWPAERLRVVLLHELAHLKRYDPMSLILTRIAVSLFWYHPLAWSLERAGRSECERACDDLVLAGGTKPSEYADHLLAIARSMPTFDPFRSVTLAMSRKSQLEGRLLSILQPQVARRVFSGRNVAMACMLAVMIIIPVSALRLTAELPDAQQVAETQKAKNATDSEVDVSAQVDRDVREDVSEDIGEDLDALGNYFLTKLGKYDKRADKLLREPKNGGEWYDRAYDLYRNDRYAEAAAAFQRAASSGYREETALYNAACSWALLGDAKRATEMLNAAINAGWDDFDHIADDSDFDPIRSDAGFQRLVQRGGADVATRRMKETQERYRALESGVATGTRTSRSVSEAVADGVSGGVAGALAEVFGGKHKIETEWFDVGLDLLRLRQLDQAINAFERSIETGEKSATAMYNIACAYSLKGDVRSGMQWLDKAIEHGFSSDEKFENDPDIALLRKQPGFDALRQKAEDLEMRGCCNDSWRDEDDRRAWREVAEHHRRVTAKYPASGRAWFNLGFSALQARDFTTGHDAFQRAINLDYRVGTSSYNIACGYALQNNRDAAFQWLDRARDAGFDLRNYLEDDEDLESLHSDPRWDALRDEVGAKQAWKWKSEKNKEKNKNK